MLYQSKITGAEIDPSLASIDVIVSETDEFGDDPDWYISYTLFIQLLATFWLIFICIELEALSTELVTQMTLCIVDVWVDVDELVLETFEF